MKLEDPELHKVPKPWESEQKFLNMRAVLVVVVFFAMGIFFYFFTRSTDTNGMHAGIFLAGIFFLFGIGFMIAILYTNFDHNDHWNMMLPYNKNLFQKLNREIPAMLKENSYDFSEEKNIGGDDSRTFKIKPSLQPELTLYYGLEIVHTKYTTEYYFPIKIRNIRKGNLIYAHQLQKDVDNILKRAEYKSFSDEGKSFPF